MEGEVTQKKNHTGKNKNLAKRLKRPAVAGIIVTTPFLASFLILKWFLGLFKGIPGYNIFYITSNPLVNEVLKASAFTLIGGATIIGLGKFTSTDKGVKLEEKIDLMISKLPFIGSVYSITKTATDTVLRRKEDFQHPVKLSYQGLTLTAFQTGEGKNGKKTVFVPTSPNITSGFVVEVDETQLEQTDDTLEQAFTRVLSAGFSN